MQVPVLLIRQVLVNASPALTLLLSGMVTSATKDALLVQSGALVGRGGSGVAEGVSGLAGDSVAAGASVAGTSVAVEVWISVEVGAGGDSVDCPLQAERITVNSKVTLNSFLIILNLLIILFQSPPFVFNSTHFSLKT